MVPVGVLLGSDGVCKEACILHLCDRIHCLALHLKEETEYSVTNLVSSCAHSVRGGGGEEGVLVKQSGQLKCAYLETVTIYSYSLI